MRVFVSRDLPGRALTALEGVAEADVWSEPGPPPYDVLLERVRGCDGLLSLLTDTVDETVLASGVRVVSQMAAGVDNIDVDAATRMCIPVGHTPGVLTETTADLAWALILAAARRITEAERFVRTGSWTTWSPSLLCGWDVHGATLGIVGYGAIGRAVARRALGFDMKVLYTSRSAPGAVSLEELLSRSDVVSVHTALTAQTRHLIGARELEMMKRSAILVNTSRGGVVDEAALARALASGRIAAAGLDVFESEPVPADSPLLSLDNVVCIPHIGSASVATRSKMAAMAVTNLIAGLRGDKMPHCVNPSVYR